MFLLGRGGLAIWAIGHCPGAHHFRGPPPPQNTVRGPNNYGCPGAQSGASPPRLPLGATHNWEKGNQKMPGKLLNISICGGRFPRPQTTAPARTGRGSGTQGHICRPSVNPSYTVNAHDVDYSHCSNFASFKITKFKAASKFRA